MIEQYEVAVVGSGPAGLEAAITMAEADVKVVIIEEASAPGGQYYKQYPSEYTAKRLTRVQSEGAFLVSLLEGSSVQVYRDTVVWGAFPDPEHAGWMLSVHGADCPKIILAKNLILATGAYDMPVPFPGWTLPGVITAGAGQILVKNQRVVPGKRILLAGSGPLQLALAAELIEAGAEVLGIFDAARPFMRSIWHLPALWGQWDRMIEGFKYGRMLIKGKVPYHFGWAVVEARGDQVVEEVVVGKVDRDWKPISGTEQIFAADTLISGYGLVPNCGLSRMLGCEHFYSPEYGGIVPIRDDTMQTTLPGVYVIGDAAGIGGAELARLEGKLVANVIGFRLGYLGDTKVKWKTAPLHSQIRQQGRFAKMLGDLFAPKMNVTSWADDQTTICRCEELTLHDIRKAIQQGARSVNEVKILTRSGMGNCQGRMCEASIARILLEEISDMKSIDEAGMYTIRPPLHPLPVSVLAEAVVEEEMMEKSID